MLSLFILIKRIQSLWIPLTSQFVSNFKRIGYDISVSNVGVEMRICLQASYRSCSCV